MTDPDAQPAPPPEDEDLALDEETAADYVIGGRRVLDSDDDTCGDTD